MTKIVNYISESFEELKTNAWWRKHNISLILLPDPVIENIEIKKLKKKSLELAGLI